MKWVYTILRWEVWKSEHSVKLWLRQISSLYFMYHMRVSSNHHCKISASFHNASTMRVGTMSVIKIIHIYNSYTFVFLCVFLSVRLLIWWLLCIIDHTLGYGSCPIVLMDCDKLMVIIIFDRSCVWSKYVALRKCCQPAKLHMCDKSTVTVKSVDIRFT